MRERQKLYIFSSHLGLIRCLTPIRVSAIIYSQAFLDKHRNTTNVILPHELKHGSCMLSKQALISVTNILQPWALKHNMLFITRVMIFCSMNYVHHVFLQALNAMVVLHEQTMEKVE